MGFKAAGRTWRRRKSRTEEMRRGSIPRRGPVVSKDREVGPGGRVLEPSFVLGK